MGCNDAFADTKVPTVTNREIIERLSLEEKARLLGGADFWHTADLSSKGVPPIMLADGPHGVRKQAESADNLGIGVSVPATCFPTAVSLSCSFDEELIEKTGRALGEEAAAYNVSVLLGPGVNIKRNPLCGRNFEYFSEDPYLAGKIAAAHIKGVQTSGVSACVKHFAANNQEWRRMTVDSVIDERTLREVYLTPFELAVKCGQVKTVMTSYNRLNGEYTNENEHLLKDILRGEWGFSGVVVTDWGGCNDRVSGLKAGNELEMPSSSGDGAREIVNAVNNGSLSIETVNECVDRLITLILSSHNALNAKKHTFDKQAHHSLAREIAEGSIVLLKNDGILPLKSGVKTAVIGDFAFMPRYQGAGSSIINPTMLDKPVDLMQSCGINVAASARGFDRYGQPDKNLLQEALVAAEKAEVILLYLGLDEITEAEGLDRKDMKLPQNQIELLCALAALNKKIVIVLAAGSAVETDFDENAAALVYTGLSGQAGAGAALNIITGRVNPSGKLSESYPVSYENCPSAPYFPGKEQTAEYREGLFVGYRYYDKADVDVKYPFGFGLSYTTFSYSDLKIDENGAVFKIKNTGGMAGAEAVQLYTGFKNSLIPRPVKELKGLKKVFLEAGEEKEVRVPFDDYTFRYFDTESSSWQTEAGEYDVYICASSADMRLSGTISVAGSKTPADLRALLPSYYAGNIKNICNEEFKALIGREIPNPDTIFIKKNRLAVGLNTTISELRYARGFLGRIVARYARKRLERAKKSRDPNEGMMACGIYNLPVRNISAMSGGIISRAELFGLMEAFNGRFFKGLRIFFKARRAKKRSARGK